MGGPVNLFTLLDQTATRHGDRGAVYLGERRLHTWAQLRDRALRLAADLRAHTAAGARIAVASENRPELVELMFAIWAAERVFVPINYKLHPREMAQLLDDSGAARVFASPKLAPDLAAVTAVPVANFFLILASSFSTRVCSASLLVAARMSEMKTWE